MLLGMLPTISFATDDLDNETTPSVSAGMEAEQEGTVTDEEEGDITPDDVSSEGSESVKNQKKSVEKTSESPDLAKSASMTGTGKPDDPYIISDASDLKEFAGIVNGGDTDACATLANDIVLSKSEQWTPVGTSAKSYSGTFDGKGHIISGLYISNSNDNQGLFGYVDGGTIRNLGLADTDISAGDYVGSIAGHITDGSIENCYNVGTVSGARQIGGIVGIADEDTIIKNSYNAGSVTASKSNAGGIAGQISGGSVENSYNVGSVSGGNAGGIVGSAVSCTGTNCYYLDTSAQAGAGIGTVSATELLLTDMLGEEAAQNMTSFDFKDVWGIKADSGVQIIEGKIDASYTATLYYPYLKIFGEQSAYGHEISGKRMKTETGSDGKEYYLIYNQEQLSTFRDMVNNTLTEDEINLGYVNSTSVNGKLMRDITVNEGISFSKDGYSGGTPKQWIPIGNSTTYSYSGTFDGNGKKISGIYCENPSDTPAALFGYINNNCTLRDITVDNSYLTSSAKEAAGIAGCADGNSLITGCSTTSSVYIIVSGTKAGGILGSNNGAFEVETCFNNGYISGTSSSCIGGIVGSIDKDGSTITGCVNYGTVTGGLNSGGIVGYIYFVDGTVTNCKNEGNVDGTYAGGIVGNRYYGSEIRNCSNSGTVEGKFVGGIAGYTIGNDIIGSCVNTGIIITRGGDKEAFAGGIIGQMLQAGDDSLINCHNSSDITVGDGDEVAADSKKSGMNVGGIVGYIEANFEGTISGCSNSGDITGGSNARIGGIAGYSLQMIMTRCFNTGKISNNLGNDKSYIGGIAGLMRGSDIYESYNTGTISDEGENSRLGGAAGSELTYVVGANTMPTYERSIIQSFYNCGEIITSAGNSYAGGVVGEVGTATQDSSVVQNCYNTGKINANNQNTYANAIAGMEVKDSNCVKDCYYLDDSASKATPNTTDGEFTSEELGSTDGLLAKLRTDGYTDVWARELGKVISGVNQQPVFVWQKSSSTEALTVTVDTGSYVSGEWTKDNVTVTVTASDATDAKVYQYSINDGSSWTDMDTFGVSGRLVISDETSGTSYIFRAVSASGKTCTASDAVTVRIDKTSPTIKVTGNADSYVEDHVDIEATAGPSEIAKVEVNGTDITSTYNDGYEITANGTYIFTVTNGAGAKATETITYGNIGKARPAVEIDSRDYEDGEWTDSDVTLSAADTEAETSATSELKYKVDNGEWQDYAGEITVSKNTDQDGAVYTFKAISDKGVESDEVSITVRIDKTEPQITVSGDTESYLQSDVIGLDITTGPSGIAKVEVNRKDITSTYKDGYTVTENGEYTFTVTNGIGTQASDTITYQNIDRAKPVVEIDSGSYEEGKWTGSNVILIPENKTVNLGNTTYKYKVDGGQWQDCSESVTISESTDADGAVYTFKAISASGVESEEVSITVKVDKKAPAIEATGNTDSYLQSDNVILNITTGPSGIAKVEVNGEDITSTYTEGYTVTKNGTYTFTVTNGAGVTATDVIEYKNIDTKEPVVRIDSGSYKNGEWINKDVTLTPENTTENPGTTTYRYKVDNGEWQEYTEPVVVSENTDEDGAVYTFKAISASGVESGEVSITVKVDKTLPDGDIKIEENSVKKFINEITFGLFFRDNIDVNITAEDNLSGINSIEYYRSSEVLTEEQVAAIDEWSEYTSGISETAADAEKFIYYVRVTDIAGNVTCFGSNGVVFDLTAPEISGVTENETYYTTQKIKVTDTNLDNVTVNGQKVDEESLLAGNKDAEYIIAAADKAGNQTSIKVFMKPTESLAEAIEGITLENVTSDDEQTVKDYLDDLNTELANVYITEEEESILNKLADDAEALSDRVDAAAQAAHTEDIMRAESITADTVVPSDRETLEAAKEDLQQALDDYAGNYTEEEKDRIEQLIEQIEEAIQLLQRVEDVEDAIYALPDSVSPDDTEMEEQILAVKEQYDALSEYEQSIVSEKAKTKLNDLLDQLYDYQIIEGNSSIWTRGDAKGLTFVANGAYSKFVGIQIDGKLVNDNSYTVVSGSTVITLNPEYLNRLLTGQHMITVLYTDGEASGVFTVAEKQAGAFGIATGDSSNIILWGALIFISACILIIILIANRKRKSAR